MRSNSKIVIGVLIALCLSGEYLFTRQPERMSLAVGQVLRDQPLQPPFAVEQWPREGPGPVLDLTSMTEHADLVVVGQVVSVRDDGCLGKSEGMKVSE